MKSIIEEASSITKAIESAWKRADQPNEFSIRIFELPQKNMFGFTTKSAKIGIFYDESKKGNDRQPQHHTQPQAQQNSQQHLAPKERVQKQSQLHVVTKEKDLAKQPQHQAQTPKPKRVDSEQSDPWNKDMVNFTQDWLNDVVTQLNINKKFRITPERYHLKIAFERPIFEDENKNRAFFRNCAHLLLQSIRNKFKRPLKGFKVVLTVE